MLSPFIYIVTTLKGKIQMRRYLKVPNMDLSKGNVRPSNYLIEKAGESSFLLHREIEINERQHYRAKELFGHEGKQFLAAIGEYPSEDQASQAVSSYWKTIKQLNEKRRLL